MSESPGYFKAARGRRFTVPRDYCVCRGNDGALFRFFLNVQVVFEDRSDGLDNLNRRRRKGDVIGAFVSGCECDHARPRKRKPKGRKVRYSNAFSRYREDNPDYQKSGTIPPGANLGVFKVFQNNQVFSSQNVHATGSVPGSITARRCWDQQNPGPPYHSGGPFALLEVKIPGSRSYAVNARSRLFAPGFWWQYDGKIVDDGNWLADTTANYFASGIPGIVGYDSLAWDKLKPRVSKANVSQFLYELRDMPRMLKTTADDALSLWRQLGGNSDLNVVMNPKRIGDSFLNHEFGWVPFLDDLAKMYDTWQRSNDYISEITRDNGSWKRKRAVLDHSRTSKLIGKIYHPSIMPFGNDIQGTCETKVIDGVPCKGYCELYEVVETKVWAVGQFTYYRPEFDMLAGEAQGYIGALRRLLTLYGARISPSVIYKVTPWSWLVDWFSQFGKFIQRADDFIVDGIVSRGLFLMRSMKRSVVKSSTAFFESGQRTFIWERSLETKVRKVADCPYGFDQTWGGLSLRQAAILGAIGISQSSGGFISRGA